MPETIGDGLHGLGNELHAIGNEHNGLGISRAACNTYSNGFHGISIMDFMQ